MPGKNFHAILGIHEGADPATIKRAYRRLAFRVHPDVGVNPDPARFREVQEAYEMLIDPERRRRDSGNVTVVRRPSGPGAPERIFRQAHPEPLFRRTAAIRIPDDFGTTAPDIGEFLDHVAQNFFGFHRKSRGPLRRFGVEIVLSPDEARFGCQVPLELPKYERCPQCGGFDSGWGLCARCHGYGLVEGTARIVLDIPAGAASGERYEISLERVGIENLLLDVIILAG